MNDPRIEQTGIAGSTFGDHAQIHIYQNTGPQPAGETSMSAHELESIEKNIERLRRQRAGKRDVLTTIAPEEQVRIEQQIEDLTQKIQAFEQEKWELIARMTAGLKIPDQEAEVIVAEIVEDVAAARASDVSAEILALLEKIWAKLHEPNKSASAKLIGAISTFPPFVGLTYSAEIDTESAIQRYFPTFSRWGGEVKERLKK